MALQVVIPDAYPKLILDAIRGDQQHFVRRCALGLLAVGGHRSCMFSSQYPDSSAA